MSAPPAGGATGDSGGASGGGVTGPRASGGDVSGGDVSGRGSSGVGPRVRRIRTEEGALLRAVRLRALADTPLAFGSTHAREQTYPDATWATWAADSAAGGGQAFFLAVAPEGADRTEEAAVGLASGVIRPEHPRLAHLYAMWVAPEARGSGAGAALVEAVARWAANHGARVLRTAVTVGNDGAARLYERSGFRATGEREPLGHSDAEVAVLERTLTA
jgi:ribosomal protein S18 acetylase RimI-like enzyme